MLVLSRSAPKADITNLPFLLCWDGTLGFFPKLHTSHYQLFRVGISATFLDKNNLFYMTAFFSTIYNTFKKSFKSCRCYHCNVSPVCPFFPFLLVLLISSFHNLLPNFLQQFLIVFPAFSFGSSILFYTLLINLF